MGQGMSEKTEVRHIQIVRTSKDLYAYTMTFIAIKLKAYIIFKDNMHA